MGKIRRLTIYTNKISSSKKILVYSDLHLGFKDRSNIEKLLELDELKPCNFDYITIPGDIIHSNNVDMNDEEIKDSLIRLTEDTKTFVSIGNHDQYYRNSFEDWGYASSSRVLSIISTIPNFKYIANGEKIIIGDLEFKAINNTYDFYEKTHESTKAFSKEYESIPKNPFSEKHFSILLTHDPKSIYRLSKKQDSCIETNTDLVISGHMHCGLTPNFLHPLLKGRGFLSPDYTIFPEFAYGIKTIGDTIFLVNGAVSSYVENSIINKIYGINCTIVELVPTSETKKLLYKYK